MPLWKLEDGIHVGKVIKPHSYLGYIKVAFFVSGLEESLYQDDHLFIEWNEKPVPYQIEDVQWRNDKTANIKLLDIDTEDQAARLRGRNILLGSEMLGKEAESGLAAATIIGYEAEDTKLGTLGKVTDFYEQGPQSLLEVNYKGRKVLVPVHEDIILGIDHKKKNVTVTLPEGLLDI